MAYGTMPFGPMQMNPIDIGHLLLLARGPGLPPADPKRPPGGLFPGGGGHPQFPGWEGVPNPWEKQMGHPFFLNPAVLKVLLARSVGGIKA